MVIRTATRTEEGYCPPYTTYAVALYYAPREGATYLLTSRLFIVSGDNPLTKEEAIARARKAVEAEEPALFASGDRWHEPAGAVSWVVATVEAAK